MFENVLIGVDGAQGGRDALALARHLLHTGGRLTLAYIYDDDRHVSRATNPAYEAAEIQRSRELLQAERDRAGVDGELRTHGAPSVGRGLHELAETVEADLIVIGSSRHGLLHRVLVGDATRAALNGASCAVAVAPAGYAGHPVAMREIGVGYDGSPESEHALAVARELAGEFGTKLSAFEAISVPTLIAHGRTAADGTPVNDLVSEARARLAELGGVEPHAAYGRPSEELALYGASLDLLVVGSRGYGPLGRLVHGSTTHELARHARCPLLVLTRAGGHSDVRTERETAASAAS